MSFVLIPGGKLAVAECHRPTRVYKKALPDCEIRGLFIVVRACQVQLGFPRINAFGHGAPVRTWCVESVVASGTENRPPSQLPVFAAFARITFRVSFLAAVNRLSITVHEGSAHTEAAMNERSSRRIRSASAAENAPAQRLHVRTYGRVSTLHKAQATFLFSSVVLVNSPFFLFRVMQTDDTAARFLEDV